MDVEQIVSEARDTITVKRVFGEPYERNGVTLIPAATIRGGGGGGGDHRTNEGGSGGGFGVTARPVGAYVIKDGVVSWQPAFDLNRTILIGGIIGAIALRKAFGRRRRR
ncbi:MAG: sporulation protein [Actinomycetota bacterium]